MRIWSVILCAALLGSAAAPAYAGRDWTTLKESPMGKPTHTVYQAPQPLPTISLFNGQSTKYIQGFRTDFPAGGTTVCYQYDTMEDGSQILSYYEQMFKGNQWKIGTVTGDQIVARFPKLGYQCSIDISKRAATNGYRSGYRINFGMYKPWGADAPDEQTKTSQQTNNRMPTRTLTPNPLQTLQPKPKPSGVQTYH